MLWPGIKRKVSEAEIAVDKGADDTGGSKAAIRSYGLLIPIAAHSPGSVL